MSSCDNFFNKDGVDTPEKYGAENNKISCSDIGRHPMFIKNQMHMFLVDDEFGQPAGVVTLEDAIETLLGREIVDESDVFEDMQALAKGKYRDRLRKEKQKPA